MNPGSMPAPLQPSFPPIYSTGDLRALESAAQARAPDTSLMERAGAAATEAALGMLGDSGRRVLVLAGPGNNGGDALEVAASLRRQFCDVEVIFHGNPSRLPKDAARALAKWQAAGGTLSDKPSPRRHDLIIDGLFGIGLARPLEGRAAELVELANRSAAPILALDIPSGLNGDTGVVLGCAIRARRTITFMGWKPGLLTLDGPDHAGTVTVDSLGFDWPAIHAARGVFLDATTLELRPPPRPRNFHKGQAGTVAVVGGATGMVGAPVIAGRAALKLGAGRVLVGMLSEGAPAVDIVQPELMFNESGAALDAADVIAIGPGLGRSDAARDALRRACFAGKPLVVDADALNLASIDSTLADALGLCKAEKILTPHPAEAGRLLGVETAQVQTDRVAAACAIARRFAAQVILKGNGSVIAAPDGTYAINGTGNPGMASAGMGDALTGMAAALLALGLDACRAARLAAWLHGAAGDRCASVGSGQLGITATDVIDSARIIVNGRPGR